jgi:hypothetical protein
MQILIFILLKIVEIGLIITIPMLIGMLLTKWEWLADRLDFCYESKKAAWMVGFVAIWAVFVFIIIISLIISFIIYNWHVAGQFLK